uniref:Envoplakin-like n=1 Tax=Acanthochromis polyacanthus TaxID=80966 RepID=A0A3Q1ECZ4_9TELE
AVIARMQKNADQVEKDILQSEKLMADTERLRKQPLIHQTENADNLAEAEGLLKDLFMDVDKAKKLKHPQAKEIERDVRNLHDRWANDCAAYRDLYAQVQDLDLTQKIDWGPLLDEKLKQLKSEAYGPNLSDVEKQIAAHNILHQAIEAYSSQLQPNNTTSREDRFSQLRRNHLASLHEYMQSCSKELIYLSAQQDRLLQRDWSDRMVDPSGVRTEYEVRAHRDTVQAEWQAFLNLCLAQEAHLDNIDEHKKGDEPAVSRNEQRLAALRELSSKVVPLKLRRIQPTKPTTVVSLCDWDSVRRGETLTLKSNADNKDWELQNSKGKIKTLPGACFMIPPPDAEAVETVNRYCTNCVTFIVSLGNFETTREVSHCSLFSCSAAVPNVKEDPRTAELISEIDRINKALEKSEKEILSRLRTPLDSRNPAQDLADRLQEHEVAAFCLTKPTTSAIQREMDPILAKKPLGPNASVMPPKLSAANNKIHDLNALIDLYNKKSTTSMFLEKQIKNVDGIVSGFEEQLAKDGAVLDQPNALQSRNQKLQVLGHKCLNKLGRELDLTEKACSSLRQSFNEYCPDILRQRNQVKNLKNRYTNVNNQLQERSGLVQKATNKNQDFQNAVQSLDFFLVNLPNNTIKPTDDVAQITAKQNSQKVSGSEKDLLNLFSKVSAENKQQLSQLGTAKNIKLQLQSQQRDLQETDSLKKELNEEIARRQHAERHLETFRKRFLSLKNRRGVERLEEKEVVQYYRDPKLEVELQSLKNRIQDEEFKRSKTRSEMGIFDEKIIKLELELTKIEPKLVTKVLTEYERDPQLDKEAARIKEEMQRIRLELETRDTESVQVKTQITVLAQQKPKIREKVVKKEVVRLEKDPEMLKAVLTFHNDILEEESRCKSLNDTIFTIRGQINTLERVIPTIQPKIVTKVVKQVQQDPEVLDESKKLQTALGEEKDENAILMKDLATMQLRYREVDKLRQKVEVKEIINEIYRVDPETEVELVRLRKELQESGRSRTDLEKEISTVTTTLTTLRAQKPKVEYKEVTQEVIKEEKSPEVMRELQRLTNQVSRLQLNYDTTLELLTHLRKERDELKAEKSKVETKLVNKEIIKYENDPLLEKEADRLRRDVREEIKQRRTVEECLFDLQNQYIVLERQKPEEKIVMQEVVRLQKDPKQIVEHEKLNKTFDDEMKTRRKLELEVRQLRAVVKEKEDTLNQMDDRHKKIQVESELRQIKARILELENSPPPVEEKIIIEEVLKVEKDPKLEKLTDGIRSDLETEGNNSNRLEREIRNLRLKLEILQKEKSVEKVVYREVVRVEKDPAVEAERDHLRELVTQERNLRRDQEDNLQSISIKISHLQTSKSSTSLEESTLISNRDALQREKDDLLKQLKMLEAQRQTISVSFQQQSKLLSERNQLARQRSLKTSTEIQRLEKEILNEKDKIHQRETLIIELQNSITKEEHSETHTRETNLSTRISILDPETGKDLSPYDAYLQGLIDRNQYIKLSELECDWEEITSTGPDGDTTILQDRKSGKQYSIKDALKAGRMTEYDMIRYREGKMTISEFALLVAGEKNKSSYPSLSSHHSSSLTNLSSTAGDEFFPISGIFDNTTESRMSVRSALTRKLIDTDTALKLLEAQAATGGIIDLNKKDKLSVHKASEHGLIDSSHMYKLLNAQKAFTGVEDPVTKERLAVGQAAQKGYVPQEQARRYMEAQYLTGGLVDPTKVGRLTIKEAIATKLIDSTTADELQNEASHTKELVDPISKEKISYKQAMDRCKRDINTGLLLLPVASTDASNAPSYSKYRFNSPYNKY